MTLFQQQKVYLPAFSIVSLYILSSYLPLELGKKLYACIRKLDPNFSRGARQKRALFNDSSTQLLALNNGAFHSKFVRTVLLSLNGGLNRHNKLVQQHTCSTCSHFLDTFKRNGRKEKLYYLMQPLVRLNTDGMPTRPGPNLISSYTSSNLLNLMSGPLHQVRKSLETTSQAPKLTFSILSK